MSLDASKGGVSLVDTDDSPLNSTINTTPLVDIMLVMLIIFLITVPVVVSQVEVALPTERVRVVETKPQNIYISVDARGQVWWGRTAITSDEELAQRLRAARADNPYVEVHLSGDEGTQYLNVGKVVQAAQRAGILKIAFLTQKPRGQ
ncbi:MAG: biopolymer transporter ExbD [Hyphomonadaceae bacterium]